MMAQEECMRQEMSTEQAAQGPEGQSGVETQDPFVESGAGICQETANVLKATWRDMSQHKYAHTLFMLLNILLYTWSVFIQGQMFFYARVILPKQSVELADIWGILQPGG